MTMSAEQISTAARAWHIREYGHDGGQTARSYELEHAGTGPYHLLAVFTLSRPPVKVQRALQAFDGFAIPDLCPYTGRVRAGYLSLHVLPQPVHHAIWHLLAEVDFSVASGPFATPPEEADMAETLIQAMSPHAPPGRRRDHRSLAVSAACDQLGWRNVAGLVNGMDESTRKSLDDVLAILAALTFEPAATG
jgi:hypothetical protein